MPKKGKKDKSKKSKKGKDGIDWSLYPEDVTEIPNPNFTFGSDGFQLENGDVYVGDFCASKIGVAFREGEGIYITKDNHIYEGLWENDKLLKSPDTKVTYPDNTEYYGPFKNNMYDGVGTYTLPNQLPIKCSFKDNTPFGKVVLHDPQDHLWIGHIDSKEDTVILIPENHFYENLPYDRGIGKKISTKHSQEEIDDAATLKSDETIMRELKQVIFKKSSKTVNDFKDTLENNFARDCSVSVHAESDETCGCRSEPKLDKLLKTRRSSNVSLLRTFLSKEYRSSCPPVTIFYPSEPDRMNE